MEIPKYDREQITEGVVGGLEDYMGEDYPLSPRITLNTRLGELVSNPTEYELALQSIERRLGLEGNARDVLYTDNTFNQIYETRNEITLKGLIRIYHERIDELPSLYETLGIIGVDGGKDLPPIKY